MLTLGVFIGSPLFYVIMIALLAGAIAAFVVVRKKQNQDQ